MDHQVVPLISTFIQAYSPLRIADQVILTILQLQGIRIKFGINASSIEQELMGRNGKQWLCIFFHSIQIKIFQVLAGYDNCRIFLSHTLHKVPDILHSS